MTRHENESKEARNVQVLLIDSDSETEGDFKPSVVKSVPKLESCNVLNRSPKFLLNYSIPISDSESESEQSNEVNGTSLKLSSPVNSDLVGSDDHNSLITSDSKVVTLEDRKARRELTEERSFSSQEIDKISHKTKNTSKKSSNTCLEQIQSKTSNKSSHKNGKEKLGRSSQLVEINDPSNGHNSTEYVRKGKSIYEKSTSCNGKESGLESTLGQTNKTVQSTNNLSSIDDKKSSKNSSNQLRNILIKNLLYITEKSFTEQNVLSDQETKKKKKRKRKSEKVSLVGVNNSNATAPHKTCKSSGGTPAKQMVPCEQSRLPAVDVLLEDENNFQVKVLSFNVERIKQKKAFKTNK